MNQLADVSHQLAGGEVITSEVCTEREDDVDLVGSIVQRPFTSATTSSRGAVPNGKLATAATKMPLSLTRARACATNRG